MIVKTRTQQHQISSWKRRSAHRHHIGAAVVTPHRTFAKHKALLKTRLLNTCADTA